MKDASGRVEDMSEASATEPVPEPPQDVTAVMHRAITAADQAAEVAEACRQVVLRAMEAGGDVDALRMPMMEAVARLAELNADLREIPGAVADVTLFTAAGLGTAPLAAVPDPVTELAPRKRRSGTHRDPAQRPLFPRAVRDIGGAGGLVAAFRPLGTALKHSWVTHPVATAATGFTAATLATAAVVAPHTGVTLPFGAGTAGTPNPPASVVAATPLFPSSPSSPRVALALTKPKPDAATSSPLSTLPPVLSPVQGPGDGQGAPGPQPSSQGLAPQVHLIVSHALDLGTGSSGTIRITAFGAGTDWSAQASDGGMMLDQSSGTLSAGSSITIQVSITADLQALAGPGSVTISYGNGKTVTIPVSWTLIPLPLPSPSDTGSPVDLPTLPPVLGS